MNSRFAQFKLVLLGELLRTGSDGNRRADPAQANRL